MKESILQINESVINETFGSTNNIFDEFRMLSSSLFFKYLTGLHQFHKTF